MVALVAATPMLMARIGDLIPEAAHGLIKASGWERVHIWHRFAEAVADRWLTGYGLQASRHMAEVRPIELLPSETFNPLGVGHTHNAVLQVWVELGAVGATLLAVILALVGRQIASLPAASRPFALATFASVFAIGYVSHGAWQIWWLAAIALAAVWMRVVAREAAQTETPAR
jgi:O-antigen ligase